MDQTHTSIIPRAIRCNRKLPCSNCQTSNLACRSTSKPAAVRVSSTPTPTEQPDSEKHVDRLHDRILALENAMQELVGRNNHGSSEPPDVSANGDQRPHESKMIATTTFEGVPSFRRQAFEASQITHLTAPDINASPPVMQGLAVLQGILEQPDASSRPEGSRSSALRGNSSPRMELPPSDFVIRVLRMMDGYQREETVAKMPGSKADDIRRLFWQVYIFDKNLSLRLGRAPSIQDYDVDLKQQSPSQDPRGNPWSAATSAIIAFSSHQARIYELLYSPSSNKRADGDRKDVANRLAQDLDIWYQEWKTIDASQAANREFFETTFGPIEVAYFSVLTLVFRGATPSSSALDISPACYEAAQKGLQAHLDYWTRSVANNSKVVLSFYAIWILLYSSFTPYIITFLHCIATLSPSDLQLLKNVHETLKEARSTSEAIKRYYEICQTLYRIAEAFVEHRVSLADQAPDFPFANPAFFVQRLEADLWSGSFSTSSFADLDNFPFSLEG
ncbi:hypothetical protein FSARC_170 [Fusarium sarcochroum]|uniref:Xylanolytic transcriptional activator regulatory domain-containing protein n=1 Tax=Fusarium sarcochroum TaxID=1208366 RepID=A0A8H4XGP4_9HYPO|nr:hypothetical protein FSARC_170 [Fusarium sarcochroum]